MPKSPTIEQPEGIILTVSRKMYEAKGFRHWRRNFIDAMGRADQDYYYWLRVACKPTQDKSLLHVYLCIMNKICFKGFYGGVRETPEGFKTFDDGRTIRGRYWVLISGPVTIAPRPYINRQGFQGFRYTDKLF